MTTIQGLTINEPIQGPDVISELPNPMIQHIMTYLPYKDAARMSVLSKRFEHAWASFPIIFFDETLNMGCCLVLTGTDKLNSFLSYVANFLSRRPPTINIEKFSFCFDLDDLAEEPNSGIENAISYAIENKVKELELDMVGKGLSFWEKKELDMVGNDLNFREHYYSLPVKVLSVPTITVLSLKGFMLEPPQNWTLNFPSIKELRLEECKGMQTLCVSSQILMIVVIEFCQGLEKIEIDASNLESFSFTGGSNSSCIINITACKSLKYLSLKNAPITDGWIKHEVAQFSRLEVFKVDRCRLLENFLVSNANLKTVELFYCSKLQKIEIYSRSLNTFVYVGRLTPSQLIIDSPSFDATVSLSVDRYQLPHDWFSSFRDFLSCFGLCNVLEIACNGEMAWIFPVDSRDNLVPPLYDLNSLKLVSGFPSKAEDLLDSLLWLAPQLTVLSFVSGRKEKSLEFEYHMELPVDEDLECCYLMPCWRHHLKKVTMKNFEDPENMILQKFFAQETIRLEAI